MDQSNLKKISSDEKIISTYQKDLNSIRKSISEVVFGQEKVVDLIIITIMSGGHALIVGLPGLAKTHIANNLGLTLGLIKKRVQFTPDLMPSDIIGTEILDESINKEKSFRFIKGPIFSQLLLADEINRASPRTQSALLQAMQEKKLTVAGKNYILPEPFHVLATQNPIEHEGTYPLPEAQLDRFLMQIDISYPSLESEKKMLLLTTSNNEKIPKEIFNKDKIIDLQRIIRDLPVGETVVNLILDIIHNSRPSTSRIPLVKENVLWGPSPRASQSMLLASKSKALLEGRLSPSINDVISLAKPILKHRMELSFSAKAEGITLEQVIEEVINSISL